MKLYKMWIKYRNKDDFKKNFDTKKYFLTDKQILRFIEELRSLKRNLVLIRFKKGFFLNFILLKLSERTSQKVSKWENEFTIKTTKGITVKREIVFQNNM